VRAVRRIGLLAVSLLLACQGGASMLDTDEPPRITSPEFLAGCEVDLTGDGREELAVLVDAIGGRELIVLVRGPSAYEAFTFEDLDSTATLACRLGLEVRTTEAGRETLRTVRTPGAFLELIYPEASSEAVVWNGRAFDVVSTSD
jgi:hypothetical protein